MHPNPTNQLISGITTNWEQILEAHRTHHGNEEIHPAKLDVLRKYLVCVFQYLRGATGDYHVSEDLTQDFALRFLRGDFRNVSPEKGRFRDYLKRSLRNMVNDHYQSKNRTRDLEEQLEPAEQVPELDNAFVAQWRKQLLSYAWESLRQFEISKSNHYYCVLKTRAANPDATSEQLAEKINLETGGNYTSDWVRQNLTRARRKFSEFLVDEVKRTLDSPQQEDIDTELSSLGLQQYMCNK